MYKLLIPDQVANLIREMHPLIKKKIRGSLKEIIADPHCGKPLKEELEGLRSFRVNKFRIVYRISERRVIEIITIGPRKKIYEETFRIIKREKI